MRCDGARRLLSAAADGEQVAAGDRAALDAHLGGCAGCRQFSEHVATLRRALRVEALDAPPDVATRVAARIAAERPVHRNGRAQGAGPGAGVVRVLRQRAPAVVRVAAVALAGVLAGSVLGRVASGPDVAAASDLGRRAVAAQRGVESLVATVTLVEHGLRAAVPVRRFEGTLAYRAPDHVALRLRDETSYPPGWRTGDVDVVVRGSEWWTRGVRACPRLPECTPAEPRLRVVTGSEPFSDQAPNPLDLVVPVRSFALAAPAPVREATVAERDALVVSVTAAQVQPLLETLHLAGNLREVHPADDVELSLAADTLTPLRVEVTAAAGEARRRWARAREYLDDPGGPVLALSLGAVRANVVVDDDAFPPAPPGPAARLDLGYGADALAAFGPARLVGLSRTHAGRTETPGGVPTATTSWTDGRSYLVARRTQAWPGGRLFGNLGPDVARVDLGPAGVGYTTPDGSRLALHTAGGEVVLAGSVAPATLRRAARDLGLTGLAVPPDWSEATTATLAEAAGRVPTLLRPPPLRGFGPPAVRVDGTTVVVSFAGPGARSFRILQREAAALPPPTDPDATAARVRGTVGRYSPAVGALEWTERGLHVAIESTTLAPRELLDVAARLEP